MYVYITCARTRANKPEETSLAQSQVPPTVLLAEICVHGYECVSA